jgi:chitin synthase
MNDGDDLNVIPETFKPAVEAQNNQLVRTGVHLLPPDQVEGRFAAAERLPGGWYQQGNDSLVSSGQAGLSTAPGRNPLHPRDSFDSNISAGTNTSVYMPRRVESIMGEEDRKKYAMAQASQRDPGGAYFMGGPPLGKMYNPGQVYEFHEVDLKKAGFTDSVESLESYHDRPDQKRIESYNDMDGSPEQSTSETFPASGPLTVPQSASGQNRRSGRSPLARVSLVRTSSNEEMGIELQDQRQQSQTPDSRRQSPSRPRPAAS